MINKDKTLIFALNGSETLGKEISKYLDMPLAEKVRMHFSDGEILTHPTESVRGKDVFVVQSTGKPVNDNYMELLIFIDSLKRASAKSINVILPYMGYARQDRKAAGRQPITAKLVSNLLENSGASRVLICDLHAEQIQGFFEIPTDDLKATPVLLNEFLKKEGTNDLVIVSPDHGGVKRARRIAEKLMLPLAIVDKRRTKPNEVESSQLLGDVKGKRVLIIDDMIDTAGTMTSSTKMIKEYGAKQIFILATHPVFSGPAVSRLSNAIKEGHIDKVYVTNSIELEEAKRFPGLVIVSIAPFIAEVIKAIVDEKSISSVYSKYTKVV